MLAETFATGFPPLAAPGDFFNSVNSALRTGPALNASSLGLIALGVVIVAALLYARFRERREEPRAKPPMDLLAAAAHALDLSVQELQDLKRVAEQLQLAQPVAALLSPANLAHAAGRLADNAENRRLRAQLEALCQKLFETPLPPAS